jgi:hypothetical protein
LICSIKEAVLKGKEQFTLPRHAAPSKPTQRILPAKANGEEEKVLADFADNADEDKEFNSLSLRSFAALAPACRQAGLKLFFDRLFGTKI